MISLDQLLRGPQCQPEGATLDRPLDHLLACHRRIEDRLQILERAANHLESQPREALEAIVSCFRFFDSNGAWHTADEEASIFPRLQARLTTAELAYLEQLEWQHREADALYTELKNLAAELEATTSPGNASADLAARFRSGLGRLSELYRSHIASEDRTLIPLGNRILAGTELREISREMKVRRGLAG
jgi:hemerythrin-like domain-containing protein